MAKWSYSCLYSLLKVVGTILAVFIRLHSITGWLLRQEAMASVTAMVSFRASSSSVFLAAWAYVMAWVRLAALAAFLAGHPG